MCSSDLGADGKAIARRSVESRIVAVGRDVLGKDAPLTSLDINDFGGGQNTMRAHFAKHG